MKMIIIIVILLLICALIIGTIKKYKDRDMKQKEIENIAKLPEVLSIIADRITPERLSKQLDYIISFEMFKSACIDELSWSIVDELVNTKSAEPIIAGYNNNDILDAISIAMNSEYISKKLEDLFIFKMDNIVKDAEKHENDALEYLKGFGEDSEELHPIEPNTEQYTQDDIIDIELEDLDSTGTVENIQE